MAVNRVRELGRGGSGTTWLGRDETGREYVLKPLPAEAVTDEARRVQLWRLVNLGRSLGSVHLAGPIDAFDMDGQLYVAREYVPGVSLEERLRIFGSMPWPTAKDILKRVAAGLSILHGAGVAHLALKPSNAILDPTGNVRLTDFGLAGILTEPTDSPYTAPEGPLDARSDLYSLGAIAYHLLSGAPPAPRSIEPDMAAIPVEARALVGWLLHPDPGRRPPSAANVQMALGDPLPAFPVPPRGFAPTASPNRWEPSPTGWQPSRAAPASGQSVWARLVAVVSIAALLGGAVFALQNESDRYAGWTLPPWFDPEASWLDPTPSPTLSAEPTLSPSPSPTAPLVTLAPGIADRFLQRIKSDNFQFKASVSGALNDSEQRWPFLGVIAMRGHDSSRNLWPRDEDGSLNLYFARSILVGETAYVPCALPSWCESYREPEKGDSYLTWFRSIATLADAGVVQWHGKQVHDLRTNQVKIGTGSLLQITSPYSAEDSLTIDFFVDSKGTPLGMSIKASWLDFGEYPWALEIDYVFDSLSGIKIVPPESVLP